MDSWTNDLGCFLSHVAQRIRSGESVADISRELSGKDVSWSGVLNRKSLDCEPLTVHIGSPLLDLDLGGGPTARFGGLTLPIADGSAAEWVRRYVGERVAFIAKLGGKMGVFPAVEVQHLAGDLTLLSINLTEAAPA